MGIAAVVAGAAIGAVGSIASAEIGAGAAKSAAKTQQQTAQQAEAAQQAAGQQATALNQQELTKSQALLAPYTAEGQTGLNALNGELSYLDTPYQPTEAQLEATPGYDFTLDQGLLATQNAQAAQGLGVSGAALKAAAGYATGLAQQTYAQDATIYQQNQQQIGNLLMGIVGNGQNAATAEGQEAESFTGNSSAAITGQANAAAGTALTGAEASAAGTVGAANSETSALNNISSSFTQAAILDALLGGTRRLMMRPTRH